MCVNLARIVTMVRDEPMWPRRFPEALRTVPGLARLTMGRQYSNHEIRVPRIHRPPVAGSHRGKGECLR